MVFKLAGFGGGVGLRCLALLPRLPGMLSKASSIFGFSSITGATRVLVSFCDDSGFISTGSGLGLGLLLPLRRDGVVSNASSMFVQESRTGATRDLVGFGDSTLAIVGFGLGLRSLLSLLLDGILSNIASTS